MKWLAIAIVIGSTPAYADEAHQRIELTAAQESSMKSEITRDFYDPISVQFRNVRAAITVANGGLSVCGELNGKNRLGGYTGFRLFAAALFPGQTKWVYSIPEDEKVRKATVDGCVEEGLAEAPIN